MQPSEGTWTTEVLMVLTRGLRTPGGVLTALFFQPQGYCGVRANEVCTPSTEMNILRYKLGDVPLTKHGSTQHLSPQGRFTHKRPYSIKALSAFLDPFAFALCSHPNSSDPFVGISAATLSTGLCPS